MQEIKDASAGGGMKVGQGDYLDFITKFPLPRAQAALAEERYGGRPSRFCNALRAGRAHRPGSLWAG